MNSLKQFTVYVLLVLVMVGCKTVVNDSAVMQEFEQQSFKIYGNSEPIGSDYQTDILDSYGEPGEQAKPDETTEDDKSVKEGAQKQVAPHSESTAQVEKPVKKVPKLPHIDINLEEQYVDLNGIVCFREGRAELVVTIRGAKPHESPFMIYARPQHIHAALMMLGLKPGKPGHWLYNEKTRESTPIDPEGHVVKVTVLMKDDTGKMKEYEIPKFINNRITKSPLPHSYFVFGGSRIRQLPDGRNIYSADSSGNVVSLVSFNDELLSWPRAASHSDLQVFFDAYPDHLPKLQTPVKVRIRPAKGITMKELDAMMDQWYKDQEAKRKEIEKQFETDQVEQEGK